MKALALIVAEQLLAQLDHPAVDIHQHDFLDVFVLEGLVGDGEIAAAHDHHPLDLAMLQHRQMGEHVGIGALVPAGDLDDVVQGHHPAIGDGVEDADVLELALLVRQHLGDLHGLGVTLVQALHLADRRRLCWLLLCSAGAGDGP